MTTQATGAGSNIQISPQSSTAAALLPAAKAFTDYAVKKRNATEKIEAQKLF